MALARLPISTDLSYTSNIAALPTKIGKIQCWTLGLPNRCLRRCPARCSSTMGPKFSDQTILRRSANYQSSIWNYDYIQSLTSEFSEESHAERINKLQEDVRTMLKQTLNGLSQLQLIDTLQRLGVAYHFEDEIMRILASIHRDRHSTSTLQTRELYATALEFRLLRQYGFRIPQEIFSGFMDDLGKFKPCLRDDFDGVLSLYEASYLLEEGENILEEARDFTTKYLVEYVQDKDMEGEYHNSALARHALEVPLHWRVPRLEANWFINFYETKPGMSPLLLELAKLDFNHLQAVHQDDLKDVTRWWRNTGLGEKLSFTRDRVVECFLWNVGMIPEPQFHYCRKICTKVEALVVTIDDIYDVYGTLDELDLFTAAVERWDTNMMDTLPEYMKICYLALLNFTNEMAYDVLKDQGFHILPYLKKAWADICKCFLVEAKWYYSGYTPTLQEYLDNAWITISSPVILVHAYFCAATPITNEAMECLKDYPNIIRLSSMIFRLADDLGTSSDELKRGDVPKSIQCYMHETGASEAEAREHVRHLISETWKKMNQQQATADCAFSRKFVGFAIDMARMAQCVYQDGDGFGIADFDTKNLVLELLVQPIPGA